MTLRPVMPTVLVVVNKDSRLEIFQDAEVQVALADERAGLRCVTLLPRENQAIELFERLDGMVVVSPEEDLAKAAENAIQQLRSLSIISTGVARKEAS